MNYRIPVALAADRTIEIGLHVTLYSLLRSSSSKLDLFLILEDYDQQAVDRLHATLLPFSGSYEITVARFDQSLFKKYRSLHGNRMMFARLLLADMISVDWVIYLDSDLVVNKDISLLFEQDLGPHTIAVSGIGSIGSALEGGFLNSLGLSWQARYFNSGVMLIDLDKWRNQLVTEKCFDFANRHPDQATDQTILNVIFYKDRFLQLDDSFNHALYPNSPPIAPDTGKRIFHFVGSPKPWDFLGEFIHKNYAFFEEVLNQTSFRGYRTYFDISFKRLSRTMRLARSYYMTLKNA
jgi:lipopolysaccharide biosynthesis glycosyltransferase